MKNFTYFENQEGGMDEWEFNSFEDLRYLYGWMRVDCKKSDEKLVQWLEKAEVGEKFRHRLGTVVRLKGSK